MSLCVQSSVKQTYCFTFAPPYALKLTLDFCRVIDFPCESLLSGNRCLNTRCGITFTSAPLSILHFTRIFAVCPSILMFTNAWELLPSLYIDSSFARCVVSTVSSNCHLLCRCFRCYEEHAPSSFRSTCFSTWTEVVVWALLHCLDSAFVSYIHKPSVLSRFSIDIQSLPVA